MNKSIIKKTLSVSLVVLMFLAIVFSISNFTTTPANADIVIELDGKYYKDKKDCGLAEGNCLILIIIPEKN